MYSHKHIFIPATMAITVLTMLLACINDNDKEDHDHIHTDDTATVKIPLTLFVGGSSKIGAYNPTDGAQKSGELTQVGGLTDMQALADGNVLVSNGSFDELLVFDGKTMLEKNRFKSSKGGKRPVHTYVTPKLDGKQYFFALNDGDGTLPTNSAQFVDIIPTSSTYLKQVGEVNIGNGHHKAAFGATTQHVALSNFNECDEVIGVYDFSKIDDIKKIANFSAADAGMDGSSYSKTCDPTYQKGLLPAAHGAATSRTGRAYHNITGLGKIVSLDIDAAKPTFHLLATKGDGAGYTKALPGTDYVYSLQSSPREGDTVHVGVPCQIGQLVIIDAKLDSVVNEVPLLLKGGDCKDSINATPYKTAGPGHIVFAGDKLYIQVASGFSDPTGWAEHHIVLDLTDKKSPKQQASLKIGKSRSHHAETLSGDGKWFFVANNLDNTVNVIDAAKATVARTIGTVDGPSVITTWGSEEGPSHVTGLVE